jgi:hypothetical protein
MACPHCHDTGWVCEDHPDRPFNHLDPTMPDGRCGGAGMPCLDYRCKIPKNPPPMPPGWKSIAKVSDEPQGLQRVEWKGTAQRLAQCWQLSKTGKTALCLLFNHPFGWELRVHIGDELVRSEVAREADACIRTAVDWRAAFQAKGWA